MCRSKNRESRGRSKRKHSKSMASMIVFCKKKALKDHDQGWCRVRVHARASWRLLNYIICTPAWCMLLRASGQVYVKCPWVSVISLGGNSTLIGEWWKGPGRYCTDVRGSPWVASGQFQAQMLAFGQFLLVQVNHIITKSCPVMWLQCSTLCLQYSSCIKLRCSS